MYHAWQTFFLYNTNILQISEKNRFSSISHESLTIHMEESP